ncbi:MAG: rhodanese-like domain-containing protein [Myxococcota bacterium]
MDSGIISRDELSGKMVQRTPFTLVETLPPASFRQGHLPGAINLPPQNLAELAPIKLPDKEADIVVYCSGFS